MAETEKKTFPDFEFDFDTKTINDQWDNLIKNINRGNVVPVIGPDLLTDLEGENNLHQFLIERLLAQLVPSKENTFKPKSFSQLLYDSDVCACLAKKKWDKDIVYKLLAQIAKLKIEPSELLRKLLGTKKFPFVISTSFTPVVENYMKELYGEKNVKVLQFNNDSKRSMEENFGDVGSEEELKSPTVFYMFGKLCDEPHRYVVTDLDMMEFCRSWLSGQGVPRNITESLKKKHLLFIGDSFSNWLYRFIWFSMRQNAASLFQKDTMFVLQHNSDSCEDSLDNFLDRLGAFTQYDPKFVIDEIVERLDLCDKQNKNAEQGKDVFLSYSRTDLAIASEIKESLENRGITVWFDKEDIKGGDDWKKAIEIGIENSKLFIPILTKNIASEFMDPHEYREEWNIAVSRARRIGGRPFIIPVAEKDFDFYNKQTDLPTEIQNLNACLFNECTSSISKVSDSVLEKLNDLKSLTNQNNR